MIQDQFPVNAQEPITTVGQLRNHLCQAAAVELSTIPLYLYAAYSIKTSGYSQWAPGMSAFRAIRSVVIEEMLHLCLARNLLVSIGGAKQLTFYDESFITKYPSPMLHRVPELTLGLERCTPALMQDVFMPLEMPAKAGDPAQPDSYNTLGQFYEAIAEGFERLAPKLWRNAHADLQYDEAYWNQDGGGVPIVVTDLPTARDAINTIVEQGEGAAPGDEEVPLKPATPTHGLNELSHYAKFSRIADGTDEIGDTWPVPANPTRDEFEGPVADLATLFDAAYCYVLCIIDAIYTKSTKTRKPGKRSPRYGLERTFIAAMGGLLYPIGDLLVRQPGPRRGQNAAPTFGYYDFAGAGSKRDQLIALCDAVLGDFPSLGGDDSVRQLIANLPEV
jgi:hypothetical protein